MVGRQREGHVCVAAFEPPGAVPKFDQWKAVHGAGFGPPDDWIVDVGRAAGGGDFVAVWVSREHLPPDFPVSE